MKYRMTEREYIIEFLDDNGVARDADTQFFATHEEAELLAEKAFGKMKVRYAWVQDYRIISIPLPHL